MSTPEKIEDIKFIPVVKNLDYYTKAETGLTYKIIKYSGFAEKGSSDAAPVWKINYFTYDIDWDLIKIQVAYGAWNDRTTLTYS